MTKAGEVTMRVSAAALLPLLLLGACAPEPFDRQGTWRSTGANDANLRAMIADPAHLTRGAEPAQPTRGQAAALAAGRLAHPSQGTGDPNAGVPPLPSVQPNVRR